MRLLIDTSGIRFRAGGPAKAKQDYKDRNKQAVTPSGQSVQLPCNLTRACYDSGPPWRECVRRGLDPIPPPNRRDETM